MSKMSTSPTVNIVDHQEEFNIRTQIIKLCDQYKGEYKINVNLSCAYFPGNGVVACVRGPCGPAPKTPEDFEIIRIAQEHSLIRDKMTDDERRDSCVQHDKYFQVIIWSTNEEFSKQMSVLMEQYTQQLESDQYKYSNNSYTLTRFQDKYKEEQDKLQTYNDEIDKLSMEISDRLKLIHLQYKNFYMPKMVLNEYKEDKEKYEEAGLKSLKTLENYSGEIDSCGCASWSGLMGEFENCSLYFPTPRIRAPQFWYDGGMQHNFYLLMSRDIPLCQEFLKNGTIRNNISESELQYVTVA